MMNECFWNGCDTLAYVDTETDILYRKCNRCGAKYWEDPYGDKYGIRPLHYMGAKDILLEILFFVVMLCLALLGLWGLWFLREKIQP